jgi:hypothetical protein
VFFREFEVRRAEADCVEFHLRAGGDELEEAIEKELLAIVFSADPKLDSRTGRLLPGCRASEVSTRLFVGGPDADGVVRLGGIACERKYASAVSTLAEQTGFRLDGVA